MFGQPKQLNGSIDVLALRSASDAGINKYNLIFIESISWGVREYSPYEIQSWAVWFGLMRIRMCMAVLCIGNYWNETKNY